MLLPKEVPFVYGANVINKKIINADGNFLGLSFNNRYVITRIPYVSVYSLDTCIRTIISSNLSCIFYTVAYSKEENMVKFYTNKKISTSEWDKKGCKERIDLSNESEVTKEINNVMNQDVNMDSYCISLYDVSLLIKKVKSDYDNTIANHLKGCNSLFKAKSINSAISFLSFDYDKKIMDLGIYDTDRNFKKLLITKKKGEIVFVINKSSYDLSVLDIIRDELSKFYDDMLSFYEFNVTEHLNMPSVNSNFLINIHDFGVSITDNNPSYSRFFSILSKSYSDSYTYDTFLVIDEFYGKEDEIFKKIYIKIDKCPEWSRDFLYKLRKEILKRQYRENMDKFLQQIHFQSNNPLVKKLFPWYNSENK